MINLYRSFLMILLLTFPFVIRGDETNSMSNRNRISWAIMPQFNLNLPGNWKTFRPNDKTNISYGGGIGGGCRIQFKSNWLVDAGVSICYDKLHISESKISTHALCLERWSVPLSISLGHSFDISDEMDIIPLAGIESSYCFSNKVSECIDLPDFNWNQLNVSWGIGCGLGFNDNYEIAAVGYFGLPHMIRQSNTGLYDNKVRITFKYFF